MKQGAGLIERVVELPGRPHQERVSLSRHHFEECLDLTVDFQRSRVGLQASQDAEQVLCLLAFRIAASARRRCLPPSPQPLWCPMLVPSRLDVSLPS